MKYACIAIAFLIAVVTESDAFELEKPDVQPVISSHGKLLYSDDFDTTEIRSEWFPLHGTQWQVVHGALRGQPSTKAYQEKQIAKGNKRHSGGTPSSRLSVATDDCIVLFRFKVADGLAGAHFGFNDGGEMPKTGHLCRFTLTVNKGLTLQKDKSTQIKNDKDETLLVRHDFNIKPNQWYWMMLEVVGDQMVAQVSGGPTLKASHARFDRPKNHVNLPTRGGGTIYYNHVRVWDAKAKE